MIRSASSRIDTSSSEPTLKISPTATSSSSMRTTARTDVLDVAEASRLRAVAVDRERLPEDRLRDETRDHHPVRARLPGADRVEEPSDDDRDLALAPVRERQVLVDRLRRRVRPARDRSRAEHAIGQLVHLPGRLPVHLGRGRDEHLLAVAVDGVEDDLRPADVRPERAQRLLDDEPHADRGTEVDDDVALLDELVDEQLVEDAAEHELEVRAVPRAPPRCARCPSPGCRAATTSSPRRDERLGQMAADEPGAAGDEIAHVGKDRCSTGAVPSSWRDGHHGGVVTGTGPSLEDVSGASAHAPWTRPAARRRSDGPAEAPLGRRPAGRRPSSGWTGRTSSRSTRTSSTRWRIA